MKHSIKWNIPEDDFEISVESPVKLPPLAARLFAIRGIRGEKIEHFLNPTLAQLPPPDSLSGINKAVDLLVKGIKENTPVIIYGDYDADGITGTALLTVFLRKAGLYCDNYVPDRLTEGYSLNNEALCKLKERNSHASNEKCILLTVDCGISNYLEIEKAKSLGFSVIITDHHLPPEKLPDADAVINPHLPDCNFPFKDLAGVGVAFYLIAALRTRLCECNHWGGEMPNLKEYLDLVAIGTVADMVSLTGVNRILVKGGLEMIHSSPRPGVKALLNKADIPFGSVTAETISYQLAPRINAAGRTGDPSIALALLTSENVIEAQEMASLLEDANMQRREISEHMFVEALALAEKEISSGKQALVLAKAGWHKGMLGLVASRIANKFNLPTIIITLEEDGNATGSGRSVHNIDLHQILEGLADMLVRFGGHKAAVGLTVECDRIGDFRDKFVEKVNRILQGTNIEPVLEVDLKAAVEEVFSQDFLEIYSRLEPFGCKNSQPVFYDDFPINKISSLKRIGAESVKFILHYDNFSVECVGFGKAGLFENLAGDRLHLAYKITLNEYRGLSKWEVRVVDAYSNITTH